MPVQENTSHRPPELQPTLIGGNVATISADNSKYALPSFSPKHSLPKTTVLAPSSPTGKGDRSPTETCGEHATGEVINHQKEDVIKKTAVVENVLADALTNSGEVPAPEEKVSRGELVEVLGSTPKSALSLFLKIEPIFKILTQAEQLVDWTSPMTTLGAWVGYLATCYLINVWAVMVHAPFALVFMAMTAGYYHSRPSARVHEKEKVPRKLSQYLSLSTPTSIQIVRALRSLTPLNEVATITKTLISWQHPPSSRLAIRTAAVAYGAWIVIFALISLAPRTAAALVGTGIFFWNAPFVYQKRVYLVTTPQYHRAVTAITKAWLWWAQDHFYQVEGSEAIIATRENAYGLTERKVLKQRRSSISTRAKEAWEKTTDKLGIRRQSSSSDEDSDESERSFFSNGGSSKNLVGPPTPQKPVIDVADLPPAPTSIISEKTLMIRENQRWILGPGWKSTVATENDPPAWSDLDNVGSPSIHDYQFPTITLDEEAEYAARLQNTIEEEDATKAVHLKTFAWKWLEPTWRLVDEDVPTVLQNGVDLNGATTDIKDVGPDDGWDYGDDHWNVVDDDDDDDDDNAERHGKSASVSSTRSLISTSSSTALAAPAPGAANPILSKRRAFALKLTKPVLGLRKHATRTRVWCRKAGITVVYL